MLMLSNVHYYYIEVYFCCVHCVQCVECRGRITVGVHWFRALLLPGQAAIICTLSHM